MDEVGRGGITGRSSMGCYGDCGRVLRGVTCLNVMGGRGRRSMSDSPAGRRTEPGPACLSMPRSGTTPSGRWSGRCRSAPRSTVPISTPPGTRKRGRRRGTNWKIRCVWRLGQALGRSRGGLTTKVHLACDGRGLPLAVVVTPGNVNDSTVFDEVLDVLRVPRSGAGRPRRRPDVVIADKASSSRASPCGGGASVR